MSNIKYNRIVDRKFRLYSTIIEKYLGQALPGSKPIIFAPALVSIPDQYEYGSVFSKDGNEFFYAVDLGGRAEIRYIK